MRANDDGEYEPMRANDDGDYEQGIQHHKPHAPLTPSITERSTPHAAHTPPHLDAINTKGGAHPMMRPTHA